MKTRRAPCAVRCIALPLAIAACGGKSDGMMQPPAEEELVTFTTVVVGGFHACALTIAGAAMCWGTNSEGQVGRSATGTTVASPVPVETTVAFASIAAGGEHTCGIDVAGQLYCWGSNRVGQLGLNDRGGDFVTTPTRVPGATRFIQVSTGTAHTCALAEDGEAFCWGLAESGRLGNGESGVAVFDTSPQRVLGNLSFRSISAGATHTCGATDDLIGYCWGGGADGRLGNGMAVNTAEPVVVSGDLLLGTVVAANGGHSCGLTIDGEAYCWGAGGDGQLGNGGMTNALEPAAVSGALTFQTGFGEPAMTGAAAHTCGLTAGGDVYCWGANQNGQLGNGSTAPRSEPAMVSGGLDFTQISTSGSVISSTTCGITADRIVHCWGWGGNGQLGNGATGNVSTPTRVRGQR